MKEIIEKILEEVDVDIKEFMLKDTEEIKNKSVIPNGEKGEIWDITYYKVWQLFPDPGNFILGWQTLRDRKNEK